MKVLLSCGSTQVLLAMVPNGSKDPIVKYLGCGVIEIVIKVLGEYMTSGYLDPAYMCLLRYIHATIPALTVVSYRRLQYP